jgi:hypothetical protein
LEIGPPSLGNALRTRWHLRLKGYLSCLFVLADLVGLCYFSWI